MESLVAMAPSRRSILNDIGKVSIATVSGAAAVGSAGAKQSVPDDLEVGEVSGAERQNVISQIRRDDQARTLLKFAERELELNYQLSDAAVDYVKSEGEKEYSVVVPFFDANSDSKIDTYLLWTPSSEIDPTIYDYDEAEAVTTQYSLNAAEDISQEVHEWEDQEPGLSIQSNCSSGDCECDIYACDSWNYYCLARIIGSAIISVGACATCLSAIGWKTCGICLGAILNAGGSFGCDPGTNCGWETECVNNCNHSTQWNCTEV